MTSFYELNSQPNLTASEMLLMSVIQSLAQRVNSLECALRMNLPAAGQQLPHNSIGDIFELHRYDYNALLREFGTSRTRQQLEMQGPFTDAETSGAEAINRLVNLLAQKPTSRKQANWDPGEHGQHNALTLFYTQEQIRHVFTKMAVVIDKLPSPSASGAGWNVVIYNGSIYAYYTYAHPNRVTELVWSGPVDRTEKEHRWDFNASCRLYLPLEAAWVYAPLQDYVPIGIRRTAIVELFTSQGIPELKHFRRDTVELQGKAWRFKDLREMSKRGTDLPVIAEVSDGERKSEYPHTHHRHNAHIVVEGRKFSFTVDERDQIKGGSFNYDYPLSVYQQLLNILSDEAFDSVQQVMLDERREANERYEREAEERRQKKAAESQSPTE